MIFENVLWDFNVKGEIINVCFGFVVIFYEFELVFGMKLLWVILLVDDIVCLMSVVLVCVVVV